MLTQLIIYFIYSIVCKERKTREIKPQANSFDEEVHHYPLRSKRVVKFMSLAVPDDDDFLCMY